MVPPSLDARAVALFDAAQAARRPIGCLALELDARARLAGAYGEAWVATVTARVAALAAARVGATGLVRDVGGGVLECWVPEAGVEELEELAEVLRGDLGRERFSTHRGTRAATLSAGLATSARSEPPLDPRLAPETLAAVARDGLAVAREAGGDRTAHSELYDLNQRLLARRDAAAVEARAQRVAAAAAGAPAPAPPPAAEAPSKRFAGSVDARREAVGVPPAPALHGDGSGNGSPREELDATIHALLTGLRRGEVEPAAVERELAVLVQARLEEERRRTSEAAEREVGPLVERLERRLAKLRAALDDREGRLRELVRVASRDGGFSSAYRDVQGLDPDDGQFELKRALMEQIFAANVELAERLVAS